MNYEGQWFDGFAMSRFANWGYGIMALCGSMSYEV
jgi:hypothetical protein